MLDRLASFVEVTAQQDHRRTIALPKDVSLRHTEDGLADFTLENMIFRRWGFDTNARSSDAVGDGPVREILTAALNILADQVLGVPSSYEKSWRPPKITGMASTVPSQRQRLNTYFSLGVVAAWMMLKYGIAPSPISPAFLQVALSRDIRSLDNDWITALWPDFGEKVKNISRDTTIPALPEDAHEIRSMNRQLAMSLIPGFEMAMLEDSSSDCQEWLVNNLVAQALFGYSDTTVMNSPELDAFAKGLNIPLGDSSLAKEIESCSKSLIFSLYGDNTIRSVPQILDLIDWEEDWGEEASDCLITAQQYDDIKLSLDRYLYGTGHVNVEQVADILDVDIGQLEKDHLDPLYRVKHFVKMMTGSASLVEGRRFTIAVKTKIPSRLVSPEDMDPSEALPSGPALPPYIHACALTMDLFITENFLEMTTESVKTKLGEDTAFDWLIHQALIKMGERDEFDEGQM
ncbi:hypothetical protein BKA70DRAFT_1532220 [Coprinopsis sp. MPI-PUGE-AT-0042]|nr:hypothetical protein BKA70DRAFT_1532220 [Coprinopsis sp. MPI-PUGE-AT-0042]